MKKFTYLLLIFVLLLAYSCKDDIKNYTKDFVENEKSTGGNYDEQVSPVDIVEDERSLKQENLNSPDDVGSTPNNNENAEITEDEIDQIGRKIIKNANVSMELFNYNKGIKHIKDTLNHFDCYITNETENNYEDYITNSIIIRVKSTQFDSLLNAILSGEGQIKSKSIYVNDVTDQYIDVYQRLKNKKSVEKQYIKLLDRANTINEILNVQQYLRQIQEEIESAEAQLIYWDKQTSYSTITLSLTYYGKETAVDEDTFWDKIVNGLEMGWTGVKYFFVAIAILWPLWILLGIIIFVVKRQIKKKKQQEEANKNK